MKKTNFYIMVVILYLITIISILGALGCMLNSKFEVDERYYLIDGNTKISQAKKQTEIQKLDEKGRRLEAQTYLLAFLAFTTFTAASALTLKRRYIIKKG